MRPRVEEGDVPWGVCADCGTECDAILVDFGRGCLPVGDGCVDDEDWQWVSPCCDAEVIDKDAYHARNQL